MRHEILLSERMANTSGFGSSHGVANPNPLVGTATDFAMDKQKQLVL